MAFKGYPALLLFVLATSAAPQEIRPGVWTAQQARSLPLPTSGYQLYMAGEYHGLAENAQFQLQYLAHLHAQSGLRDVALEEKGVYQDEAQAFVDGRISTLPPALCLRAEILEGIRRMNAGIRVHLVDIVSPAAAIRRHLDEIGKRIEGGADVPIPDAGAIRERGLEAVAQLKKLPMDARTRAELRTVEHSIGAYREGLEFDTGRAAGSPYLEDREQAVASNIEDLIRVQKIPSIFLIYGSDHVSRSPRKDGGPKRDHAFLPMALRLEKAGIRCFSIVTFPLAGRAFWRGRTDEFLWTAADGHLASGETFDKLLAAAPGASLLYIDKSRERATLPSQDLSAYKVDAYVLFRNASPMSNHCPAAALRYTLPDGTSVRSARN